MKYKDTNNLNQVTGLNCEKRGSACGEKRLAKKPLGNNAKSLHTNFTKSLDSKGLHSKSADTLFTHVDKSTGEVTFFDKNNSGFMAESLDYDKIVTERFMLLSSVRHLMPLSRTSKCNRLTRGCDVSVLKNLEFNKTSFSGLQTCGSPWACPVCSAKIAERRKHEVTTALSKHIENKGFVYFLTLTFRHSKNDDLLELRSKQQKALQHFRNSRAYKKYQNHIGYTGLIRALEVTWGKSNGWHPHTHEIVFAENEVSFQSIKRILFPAWVKACEKAGLAAPSFRRGLDARGGSKAASYINKYGNELTKTHIKKARGDRFSPFDLLRSYFHDQDKLHGAKFVEFAEGMQGSRQLYWSNGLKDLFGINDKTDEQLADENQDYSFLLGNIDQEKWRSVVKYNAVSTVLLMSNKYDFKEVLSFIDKLYLTFCSSGDKTKQDLKIAKNREKYKKGIVKPEHKNYLHENTDKRCIFDKINDDMRKKDLWLYSPNLQQLNVFTTQMKFKIKTIESFNSRQPTLLVK